MEVLLCHSCQCDYKWFLHRGSQQRNFTMGGMWGLLVIFGGYVWKYFPGRNQRQTRRLLKKSTEATRHVDVLTDAKSFTVGIHDGKSGSWESQTYEHTCFFTSRAIRFCSLLLVSTFVSSPFAASLRVPLVSPSCMSLTTSGEHSTCVKKRKGTEPKEQILIKAQKEFKLRRSANSDTTYFQNSAG